MVRLAGFWVRARGGGAIGARRSGRARSRWRPLVPVAMLASLSLLLLLLGWGVSRWPRTGAVTNQESAQVRHVLSSRLPIVIAVDPGHGGVDPGAVGASGTLEKDIVLDIARGLARELKAADIKAVLTRDTDVDYYTAGKRSDLNERLRRSADAGALAMVSVHANSFPDPRWSGAQTFYYRGRPESQLLAESIQRELAAGLGPNSRVAQAADIYMLRKSEIPAVTVEVGFLSNPQEETLLCTSKYRSRVAAATCAGVLAYLSQRRRADDAADD